DWGLLTATPVLYMVPTVLLSLFVRRYLLRAHRVRSAEGLVAVQRQLPPRPGEEK
ncbi:MAG: hypothetical protein K0R13_1475, partial [Propionibacteriaceae bacterium]|nr:hypothetical protein [Propionibacteriaceae bacterium]